MKPVYRYELLQAIDEIVKAEGGKNEIVLLRLLESYNRSIELWKQAMEQHAIPVSGYIDPETCKNHITHARDVKTIINKYIKGGKP